MATLRLRVESFAVRHQSSCIASDWRDGQHHLRFRGYEPRWVRTWSVRGQMYSRGELMHLLAQQRSGGLGGAEWDWTPPRELSAIKVTALSRMPVDVRAANSLTVELEITECLSPDT